MKFFASPSTTTKRRSKGHFQKVRSSDLPLPTASLDLSSSAPQEKSGGKNAKHWRAVLRKRKKGQASKAPPTADLGSSNPRSLPFRIREFNASACFDLGPILSHLHRISLQSRVPDQLKGNLLRRRLVAGRARFVDISPITVT